MASIEDVDETRAETKRPRKSSIGANHAEIIAITGDSYRFCDRKRSSDATAQNSNGAKAPTGSAVETTTSEPNNY